ncbi:MAG: hypothetical protein ACLUGY_21515 [Phocaeicola massiliensis]
MPLSSIQQQLVSVLKDPDNIRTLDRPTEKAQLVAVQKNPDLYASSPMRARRCSLPPS